MAKFAVLFLLLSSVFVLTFGNSVSVSKRKVRLCGARLVETLTMVCDGDFYGPNLQARDLRDDADIDMHPLLFMGFLPTKGIGFDGHSRLGRRQLMGVVDECCKKQCSFSTLASYCRG